jgi:2-C-methyl-D-erythritol 4-phosphate cytidylyltransferase
VASGEQVTDEASAMEVAGFKPIMIAGNKDNIKITVEADLLLASQILKNQASDNGSK